MTPNRRQFFATLAGFAAAPFVQPPALKPGDRITIAGVNSINPKRADEGLSLRVIRTYDTSSDTFITRVDATHAWARTRPVNRFMLEEQRQYNRYLSALADSIGGPDA